MCRISRALDQSGSSSHPGAGLFFSFGDDPLLEEDMSYIATMEAQEELGKATGKRPRIVDLQFAILTLVSDGQVF